MWTEQTERQRFLWGVLCDAVHARENQWADETVRHNLDRYRWHVGEARYGVGWTPPVMPAGLHSEPRPPEPVPTVPRAGMNGGGR